MKVQQVKWSKEGNWSNVAGESLGAAAQLAIVFGSREVLSNNTWLDHVKSQFPHAIIASASTSGEIAAEEVNDNTCVVTAIAFEKTTLKTALINTTNEPKSFEAGKALAQSLPQEHLQHVFVLSDGLTVNGTDLIAGLNAGLASTVSITGGLAGDGALFQKTTVGLNAMPESGNIVAIGFYGNSLKVGYGSLGGWDSFGQERLVTRSEANVLYELDGKPALELYKTYLGDKAAELPASGLLFPLNIRSDAQAKDSYVRTILAVSEADNSLTFAGDIPQGSLARLMKATNDKLVDGAENASENAIDGLGGVTPQLALLVSCVGRKLVMNQMVEDEIEAVRGVVGDDAVITGFYSYGELAPEKQNEKCYLHNQTMTITLMAEV